jgi:hypothetical protein
MVDILGWTCNYDITSFQCTYANVDKLHRELEIEIEIEVGTQVSTRQSTYVL